MICRQSDLGRGPLLTFDGLTIFNKLATTDKPATPLRAKSVCLSERPKDQYGRSVRSADTLRGRYSDKQYVLGKPCANQIKRESKSSTLVKEKKGKVVEKLPCAISVQNLSIPMTYADNNKHPTSKRINSVSNSKRIDNITKSNLKQALQKKLCHAACGKETENKLLLQISEADQVSDFERILNSNAILWERARGHVWRGSVAAHGPTASLLPRPRSSYCLDAVSHAYHTLFRQHEESLQQLVDRCQQEAAEHSRKNAPSLLGSDWFENLQSLTEFYEDDSTLQEEIETITDRIVTDTACEEGTSTRSNFNVNLAGLISLKLNGESVSPTFRDDLGPSPEVEKPDGCDEKEWLSPIMSANSDDRRSQDNSIDCLARDLNTVQIECDGKVPTITFSNCCEGRGQADNPNSNDVVIHLAVPSIESADEARPPMM